MADSALMRLLSLAQQSDTEDLRRGLLLLCRAVLSLSSAMAHLKEQAYRDEQGAEYAFVTEQMSLAQTYLEEAVNTLTGAEIGEHER